MICPNCGSNNPDGTAFCANCGSPVSNGAPNNGAFRLRHSRISRAVRPTAA